MSGPVVFSVRRFVGIALPPPSFRRKPEAIFDLFALTKSENGFRLSPE